MLSGPFLFTNTFDWLHWQQWNVKSANADERRISPVTACDEVKKCSQHTMTCFSPTNMSMDSHTEHNKRLDCQWWCKSIKTLIKRIQLQHLPYCHKYPTHIFTHKWTIASIIYCCYTAQIISYLWVTLKENDS